ncbi:hypothetical protein VTL71DRAFT_4363 [Oculimacula yallundae]|uniref:Uncharacterized protein n=1 Tax=Oculimacula yallundae TaxID=86028 RepID=A0ABR4C1V0_9HELO
MAPETIQGYIEVELKLQSDVSQALCELVGGPDRWLRGLGPALRRSSATRQADQWGSSGFEGSAKENNTAFHVQHEIAIWAVRWAELEIKCFADWIINILGDCRDD